MSSTVSDLIAQYLDDKTDYQAIYLYFDKQGNPHVVVTESETGYDWTDVFSTDYDIKQGIEANKKVLTALQVKIRTLEKDKKALESAIKKIASYQLTTK